jgi:hypothetical protein
MKRMLALALALCAAPALAGEIDWQAAASQDVVRIITVDPDGELREKKVWIVVQDGSGWLRTGNSRWLANIRRDPEVKLRVGEELLELRAEEIGDAAARGRVDAAMRAKYGWTDRMIDLFRWRDYHVLRLSPRAD